MMATLTWPANVANVSWTADLVDHHHHYLHQRQQAAIKTRAKVKRLTVNKRKIKDISVYIVV